MDDYRAIIPDSQPVIPAKAGIQNVGDANNEPKIPAQDCA